ncbi:MAG: hypothetical protein WC410_01270 [Candidatus Paceibacterota bacterium]|jgi:hypothetical protein|nr:hypothetical protein [Candidatus Paceibacterota bacterium]MDD5555552.1 hypothetical protein [Candidatus Paceibacterota bacterium]
MAIELKEKEGEQSVAGNIVFFLSFLILLIIAGGVAYLQFMALPKNENKIAELNTALSAQKSEEMRQLESQAYGIEQIVSDYKILFENRPVTSNFFDNFEVWAHPQIYYSSFSLSSETRTATMKGSVSDFRPIIQQIKIFRSQDLIESFQVSNVKLSGTEGVDFDLSLVLKAELFK